MRASAAELAIVHQARAGLSVLRRTRDDRRRLVRPQRVRAALATEVAHEHLARVRLRQPRLVTRVLLPLARVRARLRRPAPRVGRRQPPKYYWAGVSPKYYCALADATLGVGGRRADRATTKRVGLGCAPPAVAAASSGAAAVSPNEDSPGLARGCGSGLSGVGVLKLSELQTMRGLVKSVGARRDASLHGHTSSSGQSFSLKTSAGSSQSYSSA